MKPSEGSGSQRPDRRVHVRASATLEETKRDALVGAKADKRSFGSLVSFSIKPGGGRCQRHQRGPDVLLAALLHNITLADSAKSDSLQMASRTKPDALILLHQTAKIQLSLAKFTPEF